MPVFYRLFNRYLGDYLRQQLVSKMQLKLNISNAKQVKAKKMVKSRGKNCTLRLKAP